MLDKDLHYPGLVELAEGLRAWLASGEDTIGDVGTYGGKAWVWVTVGGTLCRLHSDTSRQGVQSYLDLCAKHGDELSWFVEPNRRGRLNKICPGPPRLPIPGFFAHTKDLQTERRAL